VLEAVLAASTTGRLRSTAELLGARSDGSNGSRCLDASLNGSSSCSICAAGRYSRSDHAGCTTCANGQNSDSMSTSCQACSARSDCQCDVVAINQPLAGADDYCGPCTSVGGSGSYYFITDSCRDRFAPAGLQATIQQRRNGATIYNGGAKVWRDDPDSSHVPAHYDATVTMGRRDPGGGQWAIGDVIIFVW